MAKIYVGNLPFTASEADVRSLFSQHGTVESVALPTDRETGRPRGFGFVEMPQADAARAIEALNNFSMNGRPLRVNEAQDKPRTGGGGPRGGGGGYGRGPGGGGGGGGWRALVSGSRPCRYIRPGENRAFFLVQLACAGTCPILQGSWRSCCGYLRHSTATWSSPWAGRQKREIGSMGKSQFPVAGIGAALLGCLLSGGCAKQDSVAPVVTAPVAAATLPAGLMPEASILDLMLEVVDPNANDLWQSVGSVSTPKGEEERTLHTDADWSLARRRALLLAEAANMLVIAGRPVCASRAATEAACRRGGFHAGAGAGRNRQGPQWFRGIRRHPAGRFPQIAGRHRQARRGWLPRSRRRPGRGM